MSPFLIHKKASLTRQLGANVKALQRFLSKRCFRTDSQNVLYCIAILGFQRAAGKFYKSVEMK